MVSYTYLAIPLISALIGWITNFIAVKMIFRPRKPINILGFKIIGLIPKRKSDLARKIGETIEKELISHEDIQAVINTKGFHQDIINSIMGLLDAFVKQKLAANPFVALLLSGELADQVREMVRNEIHAVLPHFMEKMFITMEEKLDFKAIVQEKIENFDMSRFEEIVYKIAAKELQAIEWFGAILGFCIGIIQVFIIISNKTWG